MGRLEGKRAVVLGAAGKDNMGQVIARRFAAEGATVLVAGRKAEYLDEFVAAHPGSFKALCDITSKADNDALGKAATEAMGGVDIAINAVGWAPLMSYLDTTEEQLQKLCDIQYKGPFMFFQAMIREILACGSPSSSLVQLSSATATIMLEHHAAYMGTKAGMDHVMRTIANEFGQHGIKANSVSPGLTETPMTAANGRIPGVWEVFEKSYPLGRVGTSDDIAAGCVWLSSDECFMSGQNLQVNGGLTLRRNPTRAEIEASVVAHMQQAAE